VAPRYLQNDIHIFFSSQEGKRDPTTSVSFSPQILTYFQQEENWEKIGNFLKFMQCKLNSTQLVFWKILQDFL
jgi:hypothetical protein